MKELTFENSKEFAEINFKQLDSKYYQQNMIHSRCMIKALEELHEKEDFDLNKLKRLAWVHDIGKIKGKKDHAIKSVEILEQEFELDDVDKDCILNHGSGDHPTTKEGKLFRCSDGLSLFYPEFIQFIIDSDKEEGKSKEKIKEKIEKKFYKKYKKAYSDFPLTLEILDKNFNKIEV